MFKFIRTTRTQTGLTVCARLNRTTYEAGIRITDAQMQQIVIAFGFSPRRAQCVVASTKAGMATRGNDSAIHDSAMNP